MPLLILLEKSVSKCHDFRFSIATPPPYHQENAFQPGDLVLNPLWISLLLPGTPESLCLALATFYHLTKHSLQLVPTACRCHLIQACDLPLKTGTVFGFPTSAPHPQPVPCSGFSCFCSLSLSSFMRTSILSPLTCFSCSFRSYHLLTCVESYF